jgi:hypothetical protein
VPIGKNASKNFSDLLKKEIKDNAALSFQIIRNDITESFNVTPVESCDYPLIVANDDAVNAFADGNNGYVLIHWDEYFQNEMRRRWGIVFWYRGAFL